jgi:hypothetical protein
MLLDWIEEMGVCVCVPFRLSPLPSSKAGQTLYKPTAAFEHRGLTINFILRAKRYVSVITQQKYCSIRIRLQISTMSLMFQV